MWTGSITWRISCLLPSWGLLFWMCHSLFPIPHLYFCKETTLSSQTADPFFWKHHPDSQLRARYIKSKIQHNQTIFFTIASWSRCFSLERDETGFRISLQRSKFHLSSPEFVRKRLGFVPRNAIWLQLHKYPPKAPYFSMKEHAAFLR